MKKDLITVADWYRKDIEKIFELAGRLKKDRLMYLDKFRGRVLGLIFQKPSSRTRVSFEVAMAQLGGQTIYMSGEDIKMAVREPVKDIGKVFSRYLDIIAARVHSHADILELAQASTVPVINALSDLHHPCQALSDIFTLQEKLKSSKGITLAYVGDGNNVAHSLLEACAVTGVNLRLATPKGYEPDKVILAQAVSLAKKSGAGLEVTNNPLEAVKGADAVYTDVWTSMGQEKEREKRKKDFDGFQVNQQLLKAAGKATLVMHCLPAHRGEEIAADIIDGAQSIVYDQAENRMHVQKAILATLLELKQERA